MEMTKCRLYLLVSAAASVLAARLLLEVRLSGVVRWLRSGSSAYETAPGYPGGGFSIEEQIDERGYESDERGSELPQ